MTMIPQVTDVARVKCKASILIEGLSGRGKSGAALAIAFGLSHDWSKIFALDTENRSLPLYKDLILNIGEKVGTFKYASLLPDDGFKPSFYQAYQNWAEKNGMAVCIQDSISHMWMYAGGVLSMVNEAQASDNKLNKWTAWGTPEVMAEKQLIMDLIRNPNMHIISTIRVKEKLEMEKDANGKNEMKSLGEQQIGMPDLKYEPDLVLSMVEAGTPEGKNPVVKVLKSRYPFMKVDELYELTAELIEQMRLFLDEGADPAELLKQQHADYIKAVKAHLDSNPGLIEIWKILKENAGFKDTPLSDIPLSALKQLAGQIMTP